jgi:hypothetical protein
MQLIEDQFFCRGIENFFEDLKKNYKCLCHKGVTAVSFFNTEQEQLTNYITKLEGLQKVFVPAKKSHFTLLSLFDNKRKQDPFCRKLTLQTVEEFFDEYKPFLGGTLQIKCDLIRPGSWYKNSEEIFLVSNGTALLMADLEHPDTQKFLRVANVLERYLKEKLPNMFDQSFKRKFPTVWCTLGYFTRDFEVTPFVKTSFPRIETNEIINIRINDVEVVEFETKDLDNAERILGPFNL